MITIMKYENKCVDFFCGLCKKEGQLDISDLISDNCAVVIDVICSYCGDRRDLYVLVNKDSIKALELQAKMDFLKVNRAARASHGNQINESGRNPETKIS